MPTSEIVLIVIAGLLTGYVMLLLLSRDRLNRGLASVQDRAEVAELARDALREVIIGFMLGNLTAWRSLTQDYGGDTMSYGLSIPMKGAGGFLEIICTHPRDESQARLLLRTNCGLVSDPALPTRFLEPVWNSLCARDKAQQDPDA